METRWKPLKHKLFNRAKISSAGVLSPWHLCLSIGLWWRGGQEAKKNVPLFIPFTKNWCSLNTAMETICRLLTVLILTVDGQLPLIFLFYVSLYLYGFRLGKHSNRRVHFIKQPCLLKVITTACTSPVHVQDSDHSPEKVASRMQSLHFNNHKFVPFRKCLCIYFWDKRVCFSLVTNLTQTSWKYLWTLF